MVITVAIVGASTLLVGALGGYLLGVRKGAQDKLEELHSLQEEGWLTITYMGNDHEHHSLPSSHRDRYPTHARDMRTLLYSDPNEAQGDDEPDISTYSRSRRDSPTRRDDWAKVLKAKQEAEALAEEPTDDPITD